jgi:hypothetical protein
VYFGLNDLAWVSADGWVTTIAGTTLILTADKIRDGGAVGRIEWDRAGFMPARAGADYPPALSDLRARAGPG